MKYIDEYRDPARARQWADAIHAVSKHPWTIMEVCGGQTHAIVRFGIDGMLPEGLTLVHGPGCPVCVTSVELIDRAVNVASRRNVTFCSFGDMLRVPGSEKDLLRVKSEGGDVRIVYSPLDSLRIAETNPSREVVFFAVGFETTAPANGMAVLQAARRGIKNFSMLSAHVLVPPAMEAILSSEGNRVNGFLAAGHVCAVMGYEEYEPLAARHRVPIVVTGFEPLDLLQGILMCVKQLEEGRAEVENPYARVVGRRGNREARHVMEQVFRVVDRKWRGIGPIPRSGLGLAQAYREFDAEERFDLGGMTAQENEDCVAGLILRGLKKPVDCPAFGSSCTPERPMGALMVSGEGACAAYYKYGRREALPSGD